MKLFAYFLPQFHEIPENDLWWGKGFTEWTNVKKAKPLFEGHLQPKRPLNDNYYNLLDKKTVIWQTEMMKKYGIDGMIYYHYYFNGKKLLEKPCENLLKWTDIDQNFFFCWANHSWMRSWNGTKELLLEQTYGNQEEWERHFQYLLPFFKDKRYEKKNNMPLFMIFNTDFQEKEAMFCYFNKRCIEEGFSGLFLIETDFGSWKLKSPEKSLQLFMKSCSSVTQKVVFREPNFALADYDRRSFRFFLKRIRLKLNEILKLKENKSPEKLRFYNGDDLFDLILRYEANYDGIKGLFFEWDNTPRHGKRGYCISPVSKTTVMKYLDAIQDEEYLFINAWNEWCEGMIMEPTVENNYRYLEIIKEWKEGQKRNQ